MSFWHKTFWNQTIMEVCAALETDPKRGLSSAEAESRHKQYGPNALPEQKKVSLYKIILNQFSNAIVWVLIGALIISGFLREWNDAVAIGALIIINAIIGFIQEYKAESSLAALRQMVKPISKVIRDGVLHIIPSTHLVPGDLVLLEAGDSIPADGRVIEATVLTTQEAALTGESMPVAKTTGALSSELLQSKQSDEQDKRMIGDQTNMAFMGTIVLSGKGSLIITQIGLKTELGKIAAELEDLPEEQTHLQKQLEGIGYWLIAACFVIAITVFAIGVLRGTPLIALILTILSLAVAAIPEGLAVIITLALAVGVKRMIKRSVLIRRLSSVETLGSVTIICTDKTGTLTQNEMAVTSVWVNNAVVIVTGVGYAPHGEFKQNNTVIQPHDLNELMLVLKISALCNSAELYQDKKRWLIAGDPTEGALLTAAKKAGLDKKTLEQEFPLMAEFPFSSERKRMSVLRKTDSGKMLCTKGAPEIILDLCTHIVMNGEQLPLNDALKEEIRSKNTQLARQALRVIACAYRDVDPLEREDDTLENNLVFIGLIAMMDPPRPEVHEALIKCKRAGIRTIMITGDHKETALAIAHELGILSQETSGIDGAELDRMDNETLIKNVETISVYARVTAEHKMRIIRAWKSRGEIVAMTGDGVNDAPAIKAADIGIAMGITGTDVAKNASDMVIMDDNFASIVNAVEEGRGIYDSIIKFLNYLLSSNCAELMVLFIGAVLGFISPAGASFAPLLPIQILWVNLISDGLPAIALVFDPLDPHIMDRPPRNPADPLIPGIFALELFLMGTAIAVGALTAGYVGLKTNAQLGNTMVLTTLILLEFMRIQMVRERYGTKFFANGWVILSLVVSIILQLIIIYSPFFQKIFDTVPLGLYDWTVVLICMLVTWGAAKLVQRPFKMSNT